MPTAKRKGNKQPADDPALKEATKEAAATAEKEAKTGNVSTSSEPPIVSINANLNPDELHLRDSRE